MRVLSAAFAAVVAMGTVSVAAPVAVAAAATRLPAPTEVKATPGVGQVTVSWNPVTGTSVTYTVTSAPSGKSCSTVSTSCVVSSTTSTPYSFTVTASAPGFTTSSPSKASAPLNPHLVLVVAGQSNATGDESYATDPVTTINYMAPPYANGADSHDLITWMPWSVLPGNGANPVPLDSPQQIAYPTGTVTIFGPEIGLARQLWNDTGRSATVIKTADASTSLAVNWAPRKSVTPPNGLFGGMVTEIRAVMGADAAAGQFDVLGGLYWYQGESDATKKGWAAKYKANLTAFINAFRAQLPISPTAPVVLAEEDVSQYMAYLDATQPIKPGKYASWLSQNAEVRAADVWAAANLPDVRVVDTSGLPRVAPLFVHVDNVAEISLGDQMAKVSEALLP